MALVLVVAGAVGLTSAAHATGAPAATISIGNGVLYSDCRDHAFSYAVTVPAGSTSWTLDVTAYGPDGLESGSEYLYGSDDNPTPGAGDFFFCAGMMAGTYTIQTVFEWTDQDYNSYSTAVAPVSFTMRKPFTRTTLAASTTNPDYGQRVKLKVTSKDERPAGYFASDYAKVRVQRYTSGEWATIKGGRLTIELGKAVMRYRFASTGREKFRAVTVPHTRLSGSTSTKVVLR